MQEDKLQSQSRPGPAAEMFHRLHQFVMKYDADGQAELFAEEDVWEFPLATESIPRRIEGRENIRTFGKAGMEQSKSAGRRITGYSSVVIHETLDSNTAIVEFELVGEILATGEKYRIPYVQVLNVMDGEIVSLRDYFRWTACVHFLFKIEYRFDLQRFGRFRMKTAQKHRVVEHMNRR